MDLVISWFNSLLLLISTYVGYLLYKRYQKFQIFSNLGIPGPKPHFLKGNLDEMKMGTELPALAMVKWKKLYGHVYGYFRGITPTLVISDAELMKRVLIHDFNNFTNRPRPRFVMKVNANSLIGLEGEIWKDVRRIITPTFSALKMKQLANIMNQKVQIFCEEIDKIGKDGREFDIYDRFQRLTLDVIGECALALKMRCQKDENDFMFSAVRDLTKGIVHPIVILLEFFPKLVSPFKYWFRNQPSFKLNNDLLEDLSRVVKTRREDGNRQKTVDALQLMIDAAHDLEEVESNEVKQGISKRSKRHLTDDQIVANCWVFLLAGYETTSTALAFTAHLLAMYPDVQEKVYQEIVSRMKDDRIPTYDDAHNLQYLDQVINESLRLYPPVILFVNRECAHDYNLKNGITIPAGMKIQIPIYSIHHDPELWPDPEKFDPDRFSPENKIKIPSLAHIPFGVGPRNCIGMRFALLEVKLTLIRLIRKYRLVPSSKTKNPPEVTVPHATFVPKNGIHLKLETIK